MPLEVYCSPPSTIHVQLWMWKLWVSFFLVVTLNNQGTNAFWQLLFLRPIQAGPELLTPNDYWLPGEVVPVDYVLKLVVHMGNLTTRGEVRVEVEVVKDTSTITLHANSRFVKIAHDKVVVQEVENRSNIIPLKDYKEDSEKDFYTLTLASQVKRGQSLLLTLPFTGVIRDGRRNGTVLVDSTDTRGDRNEQFGFYVSTDGEWGIMALTFFVPHGARKAFPCFDEPKLKANFSLSLARPKQYSSLGNMPHKEVGIVMEEDHNYRWDHYEKSPKMSTYLVKWVVSTFNYVEANTTRGVRVRAYYGENANKSMSHGVESAAKILDHLEKVFKMEYQLPKIDLVAVPFFRPFAMEDWGLITFRISYLQFEEDNNWRFDINMQKIFETPLQVYN